MTEESRVNTTFTSVREGLYHEDNINAMSVVRYGETQRCGGSDSSLKIVTNCSFFFFFFSFPKNIFREKTKAFAVSLR